MTVSRHEPASESVGAPEGGAVTEGRLRATIEWSNSLPAHLRELYRYRELLWLFTQRELRVRYRQTALGALWALLQPLSLMLVFTVFFSLFAGLPSDNLPYPLFSLAGLLPWTFFSTAMTFAVPSLISNAYLVGRTSFPREIMPLAAVLVAAVDLAVASLSLVGLMLYYGFAPTLTALYLAPLLLILLVFTTGVSLLLSSIVVLYRDVRFTVPLVMQIWMFVTPILYPLSVVPDQIRPAYLLINPLAAIVHGYRQTLLLGETPEGWLLLSSGTTALAVLWLGYGCFKRLERSFADLV